MISCEQRWSGHVTFLNFLLCSSWGWTWVSSSALPSFPPHRKKSPIDCNRRESKQIENNNTVKIQQFSISG